MFSSIIAQSKILRVNLKNKQVGFEGGSKNLNIIYDPVLDIYSKCDNPVLDISTNPVLDISTNPVLDISSNKINDLSIRKVEIVTANKCCLFH